MKTKKFVILWMFSIVFTIGAQAQKMAVGKYQTKENADIAFLATVRAIPLVKFSVRSSEKEQGTIQAIRNAAGREYASLFVMIHKVDIGVEIAATYTRNPGFLGDGKPEEWAQKLGEELKAELPDLSISVTKK